MLAHYNLKQNTWLCSKQSSFFSFFFALWWQIERRGVPTYQLGTRVKGKVFLSIKGGKGSNEAKKRISDWKKRRKDQKPNYKLSYLIKPDRFQTVSKVELFFKLSVFPTLFVALEYVHLIHQRLASHFCNNQIRSNWSQEPQRNFSV